MYQLMSQVLAFHKKMGQPIGDPRAPDVEVEQEFRLAIIAEEYREFQVALAGFKKDEEGALIPFSSTQEHHAAVAQELCDLMVVLAGSAAVWGLDLGTVSDVLHQSNMSKTPNPKGKAIKGPDFIKPDYQAVMAMIAEEFTTNPEDIGDGEECYWPTPRKVRVGSTSAELDAVKKATLP